MTVSYQQKLAAAITLSVSLGASTGAFATPLYSNGFETNVAGWDAFGGSFNATRVASGTAGVTSADGAFHAQSGMGSGAAGNWGGYNFGAGGGVPTAFQAYTTSVDIFLDVDGGWSNDTRFDFSSSINNASGNFLRDFVFNAGFYDASDATGPGAGTDRFIVSASNNAGRANSFPKNPGRDPFAISSTGWYTFQHSFFDDAGSLGVDLNILDDVGALLHSWSLGGDAIAGVGGNRYGWFVNNELRTLAFDNTSLTIDGAGSVPEPSTMLLLGIGMLGLPMARRRR